MNSKKYDLTKPENELPITATSKTEKICARILKKIPKKNKQEPQKNINEARMMDAKQSAGKDIKKT